jgi:hypothetical protein
VLVGGAGNCVAVVVLVVLVVRWGSSFLFC